MFIITILTPKPHGMLIVKSLYSPMTFAAVLGMLIFSLFLSETKKKEEISSVKETVDENTFKISNNSKIINLNANKINKIMHELKEYKSKAYKSEQELKKYKNKVNELEQELKDIKNKL